MDHCPNSWKDSLPACNPHLQGKSDERGGSLGERAQSMRDCGTGLSSVQEEQFVVSCLNYKVGSCLVCWVPV